MLGGLVAEIITIIVAYGLGLTGLFGITEPMEASLVVSMVGGTLVTAIITGIFFGAVFSKLCSSIPGEILTNGGIIDFYFGYPHYS